MRWVGPTCPAANTKSYLRVNRREGTAGARQQRGAPANLTQSRRKGKDYSDSSPTPTRPGPGSQVPGSAGWLTDPASGPTDLAGPREEA